MWYDLQEALELDYNNPRFRESIVTHAKVITKPCVSNVCMHNLKVHEATAREDNPDSWHLSGNTDEFNQR